MSEVIKHNLYGVYLTPIRFKKYKPCAPKNLLSKGGRWQEMDEYGGWSNVGKPNFIVEDPTQLYAMPDLLKAAKNLENDDGSIPEHAWDLLQKAIDKAEGKDK